MTLLIRVGRGCFGSILPSLKDRGNCLAGRVDGLDPPFNFNPLEVSEGTCRSYDLHAVIERDDRHVVLRGK
jgi:hypothetical protein